MGSRQLGDSKPPQAIVKPQILTHIIEGFVIQEGAEPFPVREPRGLPPAPFRTGVLEPGDVSVVSPGSQVSFIFSTQVGCSQLLKEFEKPLQGGASSRQTESQPSNSPGGDSLTAGEVDSFLPAHFLASEETFTRFSLFFQV